MTPDCHTMYSLALFFSLVSLLIWSKRRQQAALRIRSGHHGPAR